MEDVSSNPSENMSSFPNFPDPLHTSNIQPMAPTPPSNTPIGSSQGVDPRLPSMGSDPSKDEFIVGVKGRKLTSMV